MPPDGYDTITLPESLIDRIDAHRGRRSMNTSRADLISVLLDRAEKGVTKDDIDEVLAAIERVPDQTAERVRDELR